MTPAEQIVFEELVSKGYTVIKNGWPDLLACRDGEVIAIEVKHGADTVKPHQEKCHNMLRMAGIKVETVRVSDSTLQSVCVRKNMRRMYHPTDQEVSIAVENALEQVFASISPDVTKSDTII